MIQRICNHCGQAYQTFPSIRKQFCSARCANEHKRSGASIPCAVCGKEVYSRPSRPRTYCGKSCARTAANLTNANPAHHRDVSGPNNPMYGVARYGPENPMYGKRKEQSPRWKDGRKVRKDGYTLVVAPDDHPFPADVHAPSGLKYILEHRYVMEQHLGRYLRPEEVVHHIDRNPRNNDIGNLQLFSSQAEHIRTAHASRAATSS